MDKLPWSFPNAREAFLRGAYRSEVEFHLLETPEAPEVRAPKSSSKG
jgi:hypothetical protein